ncbi:SIS domain-containing protein [Olsenella sp. Marseille-QA0557]|uniref:SIS domain-containing protein n=1 Tax=Olsenella sp. Marseille-QA0557 TaxID=3378782 RepID=UPI003D0D71DE
MEYMAYNEIFNSSENLKKSYDYLSSRREELVSFIRDAEPDEIVFLGSGSSYWLSMAAALSWQRETGMRCSAIKSCDVVMDPVCFEHCFNRPLIICASRSGMTAETNIASERLISTYHAPLLVISEAEGTPMAQRAGMFACMPWAHEGSVMQTQSFVNLYLSLIVLAAFVSDNTELLNEIQQYLDRLPQISGDVAQRTKDIRYEVFPEYRRLVSLGSGCQYGVAIEGAYVQQEIGKMQSSYFSTLEYRHGPFLTNTDDTLFCVTSLGHNLELEEHAIAELHRTKAKVLVISDKQELKGADLSFSLGYATKPEVVALYAILIMQGLAYWQAIRSNGNPDNPSGNPDKTPYVNNL